MRHRHEESVGRRLLEGTSLLLVLSLTSTTADATPQVATNIDLPKPKVTGQPADQGNFEPNNLGRLDLLVANTWVREYYLTAGRWDNISLVIRPGRLRPVDLRAPLPSLAAFNGVAWPQGVTGAENWIIQPEVAHWNQVLDGPDPNNPLRGKRSGVQGLVSRRGFLFANVGSRLDPATAQFPAGEVIRWNGLSFFDGTAAPGDAFDPANHIGQELYSAGTGPLDPALQRGVPEGSCIATTTPGFSVAGGDFLFVANYCGEQAGGLLLVQNISNLAGVRAVQRYLVPVYQHLGTYIDSPSTPTSGPAARLGAEVPSSFFSGLNGQEVNKIRPVCAVRVKDDAAFPNRNRLLLFIGVNLDPVKLEFGAPNCVPNQSCYPSTPVPIDSAGTDDGKYDYLGIIDITAMVPVWPNPYPIGSDIWV